MTYFELIDKRIKEINSEKTQMFVKYYKELKSIINDKKYNQRIQDLLINWLLIIIEFYNPNKDILEHTLVEEFIENNLECIRNLDYLKVYTLDEILCDPTNFFYNQIIKVEHSQISAKNLRLKKEEEKYVRDPEGEYTLYSAGVCTKEILNKPLRINCGIELLNIEGDVQNLQHELQHSKQQFFGFTYSSKYPFAFEIRLMLTEGDAIYSGNLIDDWNERNSFIDYENIQIAYNLYYQLYILLMLTLPKNVRDTWKKSDLFFDKIPEKQQEFFIELMALITVILAKNNSKYTDKDIKDSINLCHQEFSEEKLNIFINERKKENEERKYRYLKEIQKLNEILENPKEFEKSYLEYKEKVENYYYNLSPDKQKKIKKEIEKKLNMTKEEYKFDLESSIEVLKKEICESKAISNEEYLRYQYSIKLPLAMEKIFNQNLTITALVQIAISKVKEFLISINDADLLEKLIIIESFQRTKEELWKRYK